MARVPYGVETMPKISILWVGRTNVTDDRQTDDRRQTDGRRHIANLNLSSRSLIIHNTNHCYQQWSHTHYSTPHTQWGCAGQAASALTAAGWLTHFGICRYIFDPHVLLGQELCSPYNDGPHPEPAFVLFLPMVDLDPGNLSCIRSTPRFHTFVTMHDVTALLRW